MISKGVKPKKKEKKTKPQPLSFSSLPYEIAENCLARISKWNYPNLSLVSKSFLSFVSSPDLYKTRSRIGTTEPCLYFCLELSEHQSPNWFTLWMHPPDEALTDDFDLSDEYSLVPVSFFAHPDHVSYCSTIAVGSEIYVIDGFYNAPPCSAVRILNFRSYTWRDGPSMLVARAGADAVYVDEKIYVMGGCGNDNTWMEVFDIETQTWRPLQSHGADDFRNEWFLINGYQGKIYVIAEMKDYAYDPKEGKWEVVETHSSFGYIDVLCVIDDVMYCYTNSGYCMWFDSKSKEWIEVKGSDFKFLRECGSGITHLDLCKRFFGKNGLISLINSITKM